MRRLAPTLLAALAVAACASTRLTSTWRDPAVGPLQFRKVVGVALSDNPTLRRVAEDEFVRDVGPAHGVAGYAVIPDEEIRDREKAQARLQQAGIDGAVVFRLAGVEEKQTWVPPTTYGGMWGYWGWAAPMVYEPGYLRTDRVVQIETNVYSVADARLVWSARSETFNPSDAERMAGEVVKATVEAMRKEKLIPQP